MCTAAPTGESARSALVEFSSRIQKHISPKEKTPNFGLNDDGYMDLKTWYEETHKYTHRKCTEYTTTAFKYRDVITMAILGEVGLDGPSTSKKSKDSADYSQLSDDTKEIDAELEEKKIIKNVEKLDKLCKEAKKLESQIKSKLKKHERKNGYEKSQKYEKYQVTAAMKKLEDEAS
ncbi:hypothetical protein BASA60_003006 [Batrachochytrium salamandrivorans]|nr:hypothetical protein BASA60_003006 [Batrachochytrium salamandrivorans]KAH9245571.1 hypothetical protein BASA81_016930 [Batrachochytrium salamandrivorans]KAH9272921.1 hypothetical protein BASA83_004814 [Batrachochytrium salamandrivorans]